MADTPTGVIVMWSGTSGSIPSGWVLCDGNNGTPDLRAYFVRGATTDGEVGTTSGSSTHNHTVASLSSAGDHNHGVGGSTGNSGTGATATSSGGGNSAVGNHSHSYGGTTNTTGGHTHTVGDSDYKSNEPAYYKLYYIMKT